MAVKAGKCGAVTWAAGNASAPTNVRNWTLTWESGEGDTTTMDPAACAEDKSFIPLIREWSGSFQVSLDSSTAMPVPGNSITELKLFIDKSTDFGYKGDAFITSINPSVDVNGVPECTVNFRGTGALTPGDIAA